MPVFKTETVESKNSLVDDKLRPTAEIHILVGGPYVKDGEEHRYGHTALRVKSRSSDFVYDFGRYGETSGVFGEAGEGILRVWSSFSSYMKGQNATGRVTMGFVYLVFEHQAAAANKYFELQINAGTAVRKKDRPGMKVHKLSVDYHALGPNCTTLSIDGARAAIKNIDRGSDAYRKPGAVLDWKGMLALKAKGGADRLFLPANLQDFLGAEVAIKVNRIDSYGGGK